MRHSLLIILLGCVFFFKTQPLFSYPLKFRGESKYLSLHYDWDSIDNQPWLGYNFWCNSFLDWKVENNKAKAFPFFSKRRTAHITSHSIINSKGKLSLSSKIKLYDKVRNDSIAIYGFLIGAGDTSLTSKTNNFIFNTLSPGKCHLFGIKADGKLQLINYQIDSVLFEVKINETLKKELFTEGIIIEIEYNTNSATTLKIYGSENQEIKLPINYDIPIGNIALFYNSKTPYTTNASFDDIHIEGIKQSFINNETSRIGPILSTFYTNTRDSLFFTAQLMPFVPKRKDEITFGFIEGSDEIKYVGQFDSSCYQLRFRIPLPKNFKSKKYVVRSSVPLSENPHRKVFWGTVHSKPQNKRPKLMALNCNGFTFFHSGGIEYKNVFYPYRKIKEGYEIQKPDVVAFLGDQIYESRPEMAIYKEPFCRLDYLYKWSIWCYAFRDLTQDQPTIIMTDDHDVFQGNIWGNSGAPAKTSSIEKIPSYYGKKNYDTWQQDNGGYFMGKDFVNMVTRCQTSHLPYPKQKKLDNGIINYYTDYKYGNLNFAILEDKKFKSPPSQNKFKVYNGFAIEKNITAEDYHNDEFTLLGKKQLNFLKTWSGQLKKKKEFRIILTQSAYASLTTVQIDYTPLKDRPATKDSGPQKVSPDMDTNGWPKTGRDKALEALQDSSILFISGDQHMGAVIDVFDSSNTNYTFYSVPAIANTWPRMWWPDDDGSNNNYPLGKYTDAFGNKINVRAVANPNPNAPNPNSINRKSPGFGIVEFKKKGHKAFIHAYPLHFNTSSTFQEFKGWPLEIKLKK
tara:strand:- start:5257 stop:7635 length:2379 start_codon:yes stop_codon:yes gene_type:complete